MKMTIKQNINKESVVLKHKIALETATLLEDKENILYTDIMLYAMVSMVDNFIEEQLIDLINNDDRDFAVIVEEDVEPLFNTLIVDEQTKEMFEETVAYVYDYLTAVDAKRNSFIGLINTILDIIGEMEWEDLKFFFQDVKQKAIEQMTNETPKKKVTRTEFDGASAKMAALINKYQEEGKKIQEENNG